LGVWGLLAAGLLLLAPAGDPAANERTSFLPDDSPYRVAARKLAHYFPRQHGLSQATIFFERTDGPLTLQDNSYVNSIALRIGRPCDGDLSPGDLQSLQISAPGMFDLAVGSAQSAVLLRQLRKAMKHGVVDRAKSPPPNPLRTDAGPHGQAAIVRVNIPSDFITYRSTRIVRHIRRILDRLPPPPGLRVAVTGSAGYGYDYALFVRQSHDRTVLTTLIVVVVILLLVYRAPLAALVPMVSISLAAAIVVTLIDMAQTAGYSIGMAERIFVFVLMFGAGVDYSLLYLSRYRECLSAGEAPSPATTGALRATLPAILASAGTDAIGILMLVFCRFVIFQTTGPAVAVSLVIAMLASITLVPALARIFGRRLFWPQQLLVWPADRGIDGPWRHRLWTGLARRVTQRPGLILAGMLILLAIPAQRALRIRWVYDALAGIESTWTDAQGRARKPGEGIGNAAAGIETAKQHVPIGEIAPVAVLIEASTALPEDRWREVSGQLTSDLGALPGVRNVRSLTQPLGSGYLCQGDSPPQRMVRSFAGREYVGNHGRAMRLEVVLGMHTMSNEAMRLARRIQCDTDAILARSGVPASAHLAGATAQMLEIREVTQRDFRLVVVLVLSVIFLIVLLLLRDWLLTLFMVGAIGLSYLATLGLCAWTFGWIFGEGGLDWKVQIFLFVVMAAVGVDYNIFLAARLSEEARTHPPRQAVARAMVYTGPVISSCGLIMAATLGSLMVGQVDLLRQLGFALGLGMLMDTFVLRPLVLPAFAALFRRTGRSRHLG